MASLLTADNPAGREPAGGGCGADGRVRVRGAAQPVRHVRGEEQRRAQAVHPGAGRPGRLM